MASTSDDPTQAQNNSHAPSDPLATDKQRYYLQELGGDVIRNYRHWYKIILTDGSELGWSALHEESPTCGPVPSGQGAIFRILAKDNGYAWIEGTPGNMKAIGVSHSGDILKGYLAVNTKTRVLEFQDEEPQQDLFQGLNATGQRILLSLYQLHSGTVAMRVQRNSLGTGRGLEIKCVPSVFIMPLDCQFVPVGPCNDDWEF